MLTRRFPAIFTDHCLKCKSTNLQILQLLSGWESFSGMYMRKNQKNGNFDKLTVIVQLAKNSLAFSKFVKTLLLYQRFKVSDNGWSGKHV